MKKLIVFFTTALIALTVNAQWGIKGGANFADLTGSGAQGSKMLVAFYGGFFYNARINEMFSLQPELVYSSQGAKVEASDEKLKLNYLNLTPLVRYNNKSGFFAGTGPQLGLLLSARAKAGSTTVDVKNLFKSTDFSWAFALGYEMETGFGFYGRYNLGISNIDDTNSGETLKNSVIQVGIRYRLKK